ncbi:hypothetical protein CDIK_2825 [Cucumispora dikerogammari]|nr:hypothetical protein CDIK_2825 [Cucumispora dikerogammari]
MKFEDTGNGILLLCTNLSFPSQHATLASTRSFSQKNTLKINTEQKKTLNLLDTLSQTIALIEQTSLPDSIEHYVKLLNKTDMSGLIIPLHVIEEINSSSPADIYTMRENLMNKTEEFKNDRKLKYEKILKNLPETRFFSTQ